MDPFKEIKRIKKEFWDYPNYPFLNEDATTYYTANFDRLRMNAQFLFEQYPVESAKFWIELVRSKFILKFGHDINSILNHNNEVLTTEKSIQIIKTVFESSYQYFGFLAICEHIGKDTSTDLYQYWHNPTMAKELPKKGEANPWTIDKKVVSGKIWSLYTCPLLKFCPVDIDVLKRIRNAEGHDKMIVKDNEVHLFDKENLLTLTKEEVIAIANYLKGAISLCMHFYLTLLLRDRFWLFLCIFYANEPKQKMNKIPFEILQQEKDEISREENAKKKKSGWKLLMILIFFCIKYVTTDLWKEIKNDIPKLNLYLSKMGLMINEPKIEVLHKEALSDLFNSLVFVNQEVRNMLDLDADKFMETKPEEVDTLEFGPIIQDSIKVMQEYMKKDVDGKIAHIFIITMLAIITVLFQPFQRLMENLKNLVRPARC